MERNDQGDVELSAYSCLDDDGRYTLVIEFSGLESEKMAEDLSEIIQDMLPLPGGTVH